MDTPIQKPGSKAKKAIIVIIILALIIVLLWLWQSKNVSVKPQNDEVQQPTGNENVSNQAGEQSDKTAAINKNLEGIDLGDLEREFNEIDADLKNL